MKTINIAALASLGLMGLSACSNEENFPQLEQAGPEVSFSVGVADLQSRASHANASTFANFGIAIQSASGGQGYNWNNIEVRASDEAGTRSWNPQTSMLWKQGAQTINLLAYAPFNSTVTSELFSCTDMPVNVSANQSAATYESDFLVAKQTGFNPLMNADEFKPVEVNFSHALSQLNVSVTFGTEYDAAQVAAVQNIQLGGTVLNGVCNFTEYLKGNQLVTANEEAAAAITAGQTNASGQTATYSAIILPQTVASGQLTIQFKVDGWNYTWKSTKEYTFAENTRYTLQINAGGSSAQASLHSRAWTVNQ